MTTCTLRTETLTLTFCRETGALISMVSDKTGWQILRRPELGLSWRLLVPLGEELRNNPVYGEKQTLTSLTESPDSLTFFWDGVESERGGRLDIRLTLTVRAEGPKAVWYVKVENNSPYVVESVYAPYLGDLSHPEDADWFGTLIPSYGSCCCTNLWPHFDLNEEYHGTDYPTQFINTTCAEGNPAAPYMLLRDKNQGLYVGVTEDCGDFVTYHSELRPGYDSTMERRVPDTDEIAGKPVHLLFAPVHMCYIMPGDTRDLTPVGLEAFVGGWQKGVDVYRRWRDGWTNPIPAPDWARDVHSWLQLHINSPEDELRLRFTELPRVARECAEYGITAIQLVGWNDGGQDQGNPSHTPDPRLGTFEELKKAIAECQAMGVKIILFAKFTWADRATEWFRRELIKDACKDPYGDYYMHGGYEYQTPAQLLHINVKPLIPMCFASEHYRQVCRDEFAKLVELGCAGFLFDECLHHGPAQLCFDESHGHRYGWPVYANDVDFIADLRKTPGLRSDFLFAGEAIYDREAEQYGVSYFRSWGRDHTPLFRYAHPSFPVMTAITGFNDRNMLNQCLMYRYIMSYEPYNFKGMPHDYPDTMAYGKLIDGMRRKERAYLWDGEFRDTCDATVTDENGSWYCYYSVFRAADGSLGVVVSNPESVTKTFDVTTVQGTPKQYRTVESEEWIETDGRVEIPAESAVFLR